MRYRTPPRDTIVCAHCGETKTVDCIAVRPIYCSATCKRNAGVARTRRRRRAEKRGDLVPCPLPSKMRYATEELAWREARNQPLRALKPYLCVCSSWHLTSMDNAEEIR